ncbi:MAG: GAF domain-containing protein [Anaerolineae bacterium]|nr:GAF domain-containing protein [Anaerolineae bacterium]
MISRLRRRLFTIRHVYLNPIDRQRATMLLAINWVIVAALLIWLLVSVLRAVAGETVSLQTFVTAGLAVVLTRIIHQLIQSGRLRMSIWMFVGMLTLAVVQFVLFRSPEGPNIVGPFIVMVVVPLVAAGVLLDRRGMILVTVVLAITVILAGINQLQITEALEIIPSSAVIADLPLLVICIVLVSAFLLAFTSSLERIANSSLVDIQQRQWVTEFGIELGRVDEENAILTQALNLMRDRFQYLFAQVYLADEEGLLSQSVRTGLVQQDSPVRSGLRLGDTSIVSEAARLKQPSVTSSDDAAPRRTHMLTAANYAAAVPIMVAGEVMGVIDIQSSSQSPFSQNELNVLLLLADQLGTALQQARTISDLRRGLREQETANGRLQGQLQEFQQRERRSVTDVWSSYVQGRGKQAIGFDFDLDGEATSIPANDLPVPITNTLLTGQLQIDNSGDEQVVNVPITFRDQTLGAMSFAVPKDQGVSEKQIEMAQIVAERLAMALDNTRLFEQSQAQALRERKASEVTALLIGATDVTTVLEIAAANFNEALGAVHTHIYIQPDMLVEPLAQKEQSGE